MKTTLAYAILFVCLLLSASAVGDEIFHPLGADCFDFDYGMIYRAGVMTGIYWTVTMKAPPWLHRPR
jgi:hypothetical protein